METEDYNVDKWFEEATLEEEEKYFGKSTKLQLEFNIPQPLSNHGWGTKMIFYFGTSGSHIASTFCVIEGAYDNPSLMICRGTEFTDMELYELAYNTFKKDIAEEEENE